MLLGVSIIILFEKEKMILKQSMSTQLLLIKIHPSKTVKKKLERQ